MKNINKVWNSVNEKILRWLEYSIKWNIFTVIHPLTNSQINIELDEKLISKDTKFLSKNFQWKILKNKILKYNNYKDLFTADDVDYMDKLWLLYDKKLKIKSIHDDKTFYEWYLSFDDWEVSYFDKNDEWSKNIIITYSWKLWKPYPESKANIKETIILFFEDFEFEILK